MFDTISYGLTDSIRKNDLHSFISFLKSDPKPSHRLTRVDFTLKVDPELSDLPKSQLGLLHVAAFFDSLEIFLYLLREGLPLDFQSSSGHFPIHYAAGGRSPEIAHFICDRRSPTICAAVNHATPLFLASALNCTEIIRALLDANVPVNFGESDPVPNLIRHRNGEMLSLVFQRASASLVRTARMMSPLMIAITELYTDAVPILLHEGADVNFPTLERKTALYYACFLGQQKVVAQLLEAGANIEFHDAENQSAIHWAAQSGNVEIVKMVVKAGANPFEVDANGRYAWVCAITCSGKQRYEVMKYLFDLEQPVNVKLRDGSVPFVDLLVNDDPELIQLFLERGLDLEMVHNGKSLREIAETIRSKANLAVISRFGNKKAVQ